MCKDLENIHEWQKDKMDAMVEYNIRENARNEAIEETLANTIKNMKLNDIDINIISKVTGKTIKEIKEIE